jgi:hypothetical protein
MTDPTPTRYIATYAFDGACLDRPVPRARHRDVRPDARCRPALREECARGPSRTRKDGSCSGDRRRHPTARRISDEVEAIDQRSRPNDCAPRWPGSTRRRGRSATTRSVDRDVGDILGISGARVAQIERESDHDEAPSTPRAGAPGVSGSANLASGGQPLVGVQGFLESATADQAGPARPVARTVKIGA